MLATEQILHKMDELYDQAVAIPKDNLVKGELLGLAEALVAAYQIELDDIRGLMAERAVARSKGAPEPTLRRCVEARLRKTA